MLIFLLHSIGFNVGLVVMIEIGKVNTLRVMERLETGVSFDAGTAGKLFLPERYVPKDCKVGDELQVFVYPGHDRQLLATTQMPLAQVNEIASLKVAAVNAVGAFLDWGLPKDLLVPFSEQRHEMEVGCYCLVKVLFDEEYGIFATPKIEEYLNYEAFYLQEGQAVNLLIADKTDVGFKAIINNSHWGLLYHNEIFQPLRKGQKIAGFIKHIREDDRRIDLSLYPSGYAKVDGIKGEIMAALQQYAGHLPLSDKSSPEAIYAQFGVSKKVYKQAIGALYKERLITIEDNGIRLN